MKIGKVLPVLGLLGVLLLAPRGARAQSGNTFLETVGISAAVGTVLGASTLPFYSQPENNLWNLVYGASAGVVVGVGIWFYGWVKGDSQNSFLATLERNDLSGFGLRNSQVGAGVRADIDENSPFVNGLAQQRRWLGASNLSPRIWMPLVSLTW
jgi:hypothetical protein